jgi:hypothetical protein
MEAILILIPPFVLPNLLLGLSARVDDTVLNKMKTRLAAFKFDNRHVNRIDILIDLLFKGKK